MTMYQLKPGQFKQLPQFPCWRQTHDTQTEFPLESLAHTMLTGLTDHRHLGICALRAHTTHMGGGDDMPHLESARCSEIRVPTLKQEAGRQPHKDSDIAFRRLKYICKLTVCAS